MSCVEFYFLSSFPHPLQNGVYSDKTIIWVHWAKLLSAYVDNSLFLMTVIVLLFDLFLT